MKNSRIDYIDFAKGFAILAIVLSHYLQPFSSGIMEKAIMFGGAGVHLFFLLSGFGLGLSSQHLNYSAFYKKRLVKIYIPYVIVILLIFCLSNLFDLYSPTSLYALGGHVFLYKMFDESIVGSFGYHFWFISTILQLYLVFPIIIKLKICTSSMVFVVLVMSLSIVFWFGSSLSGLADQRVVNSFFLQYLWEFSMGIVLADMYIKNKYRFWKVNIAISFLLCVIGVGVTGVLAIKGGRVGKSFNDLFSLVGIFSSSVLCYWFLENYFKYGKRLILFIGSVSYELYLLHMVVFVFMSNVVLNRLSINNNIIISLLLMLPLAILIATFYHSALIEYVYKFKKVRVQKILE
ncbi:MAG: peptidoglycan/LPS O-acetylase OafA/YrhL [Desulforhopalus sp.]|jgi:peptidoglycan/LPS O-acetylase OafA/YrhL